MLADTVPTVKEVGMRRNMRYDWYGSRVVVPLIPFDEAGKSTGQAPSYQANGRVRVTVGELHIYLKYRDSPVAQPLLYLYQLQCHAIYARSSIWTISSSLSNQYHAQSPSTLNSA